MRELAQRFSLSILCLYLLTRMHFIFLYFLFACAFGKFQLIKITSIHLLLMKYCSQVHQTKRLSLGSLVVLSHCLDSYRFKSCCRSVKAIQR